MCVCYAEKEFGNIASFELSFLFRRILFNNVNHSNDLSFIKRNSTQRERETKEEWSRRSIHKWLLGPFFFLNKEDKQEMVLAIISNQLYIRVNANKWLYIYAVLVVCYQQKRTLRSFFTRRPASSATVYITFLHE